MQKKSSSGASSSRSFLSLLQFFLTVFSFSISSVRLRVSRFVPFCALVPFLLSSSKKILSHVNLLVKSSLFSSPLLSFSFPNLSSRPHPPGKQDRPHAPAGTSIASIDEPTNQKKKIN